MSLAFSGICVLTGCGRLRGGVEIVHATSPSGQPNSDSPAGPSLSFTTASQTVLSGLCSQLVTVQANDSSGNAENVSSDLVVTLTSPPSVTFYSDANCTVAITTTTIKATTSSSSFYFVDSSTGPHALTALATDYASASQTEAINTNGFIWTGAGSDARWSTAANWLGGAAPSASDVALFDGSCSSNCSPDIAANINIGGLRISSAYSGSITQGGGISISVGNTGWTQLAGTFVGGASGDITISGGLRLVGGTFTATASTLTVSSDASGSIMTVDSGATFTPNGGLVVLNSTCSVHTPTINPPAGGSISFENLSLTSNSYCWADFTIPSGTSLNVAGDFNHLAGRINGSVSVQGNLTVGQYAGYPGYNSINYDPSPAGVITLNGVTDQTYAFTSGKGLRTQDLVIDKPSGTVTSAAGTTDFYMQRLTITQGSFTAPSGVLGLRDAFGSTILSIATGTTFNTNSGTVEFIGSARYQGSPSTISFPGTSLTLNNVNVGSAPAYYWHVYQTFALQPQTGSAITVAGTFNCNSMTNYQPYNMYFTLNGNWILQGDANFGSFDYSVTRTYGTAALTFAGLANQAIQTSGTLPYFPGGLFTISNTSGIVTLASAMNLANTGQGLTLASGSSLDMSGNALTINGTLTFPSGTTITKGGGALTYGTVTPSLGSGGTLNP